MDRIAKSLGLKRWYQSERMGNIVDSRMQVLKQVFESLFRYHSLDLRWRVIWL